MYSRNLSLDPKKFVKILVFIHLSLFMGQVLFAAVCLFISVRPVLDLKPVNDVFFFIAPFLILSGILAGSFLFKTLKAKVAEKQTLIEKLRAYQTAMIVRFAFGEGPSLFGLVCFLLTHNLYYLFCVGVNLIYFIIIRPTKFNIHDDLALSYEDQAELDAK